MHVVLVRARQLAQLVALRVLGDAHAARFQRVALAEIPHGQVVDLFFSESSRLVVVVFIEEEKLGEAEEWQRTAFFERDRAPHVAAFPPGARSGARLVPALVHLPWADVCVLTARGAPAAARRLRALHVLTGSRPAGIRVAVAVHEIAELPEARHDLPQHGLDGHRGGLAQARVQDPADGDPDGADVSSDPGALGAGEGAAEAPALALVGDRVVGGLRAGARPVGDAVPLPVLARADSSHLQVQHDGGRPLPRSRGLAGAGGLWRTCCLRSRPGFGGGKQDCVFTGRLSPRRVLP